MSMSLTINFSKPNTFIAFSGNQPTQFKGYTDNTGIDTVQITTNKSNISSKQKWTIAGITSGVLTAITLGALAIRRTNMSKAISTTEIEKLQVKFKELFKRDDISLDETRNIIKRYKEIEKIKDKDEYCKALFEEAKKNYGLSSSPIKLVIKDLPRKRLGECAKDNSEVRISASCPRKCIMNTMHHELRHAKQHDYFPIWNKECRTEFDKLVDDLIDKSGANCNISKDEIFLQACERFLKGKVADKELDYAKKCCIEGLNTIAPEVSFSAYYKNFVEVDARQAGDTITEIMKLVQKREL